jgi:hypothetical protein
MFLHLYTTIHTGEASIIQKRSTNPSWLKATLAFRLLYWETIPFLEQHIHGLLQSEKKLISCKLMRKTLL